VKIENVSIFLNEILITENACEVFVNDVMEEKCLQECEINPNLQIKTNQNPKSEKNKHKKIV
jgi:hypothetical protein